MRTLLPLAFLLPIACAAGMTDPVKIDTGRISGTVSGDIHIYKGIPFAAPPVGPLRFKAPQPAADWGGVRAADKFGARCMQGNGGPDTSEDCLTLNVWTPAKSATDKIPVALWIYGGGFNGGSGSMPGYDGEALAKKGIVMVTFNYRLGAFGFLAHPELDRESGKNASGNQGMMDAVAALRWIQRNIAKFGGDPKRVTIMGESAGAIMVAGLVASPEAKGLFQRAVSQSGAWMGLGPGKMTTRAQAEEQTVKMASAMGANSLADLRAKSAEDLLKGGRGNGMIVDGWMIPEDASLTFAKGKQNPVEILVGSNKDEGTFFARGASVGAQQWKEQSQRRWSDRADAFLKLYPASNDTEANASSLMNSRDQVAWHMRMWAQLTANRGKKAFLYYFTHEEPAAAGRPGRGATHTAELPFMFNNLEGNNFAPNRNWTESERKLADQMSSYWANFVLTGDPNGKSLPPWPAFNDKNPQPIVLGEPAPVLDTTRIAFYDAEYAKQEKSR